jgi:hypothetical protein
MSNKFSEAYFEWIIEHLQAGHTQFSKEQIFQEFLGKGSQSTAEYILHDRYLTEAIKRAQQYYWPSAGGDDATKKRLLRYVRTEGIYRLFDPIADEYEVNLYYEEQQQKRQGIARMQREVATSAYGSLLRERTPERRALLKEHERQRLLAENGE